MKYEQVKQILLLLAGSITKKQIALFMTKMFLAYMAFKASIIAGKSIYSKSKQLKWKKIIRIYQEERLVRINEIKKLVDSYELNLSEEIINQVLEANVEELKQMLEKGTITSEQMLYIFMKRTLDIGVELNLITETNYYQALEMAKRCDSLRKTNPEQCTGEFFGVVISVKDCITMKGTLSTLGCAQRVNKLEQNDGVIIQVMKKAGAIPFVKTNVPQLMMTYETTNDIYGTAQNPWNRTRTPGGSSGGESGLIASKCSPFGLGTDIGGSIRNPCAFTGLVGFKPSSHRCHNRGTLMRSLNTVGQYHVQSAIGPMGKTVSDNVLYFKAVLNEDNYSEIPFSLRDPKAMVPWNNEEYLSTKKMRIGYIKTFDRLIASVAQQRAVQIAVDSLRKQGHEVVEVAPFDILSIRDIYQEYLFCDGMRENKEFVKGEALLACYQTVNLITNLTNCQRKLLAGLLHLLKQHDAKRIVQNSNIKSAYDLKKTMGKAHSKVKEILKFFEDNQIEALITPSMGTQALKHGCTTNQKISMPSIYNYIWNVIQFPVGVVPVGTVNQDEQHYLNADQSVIENQLINQNLQGSAGLPIAVQISTLPMQEEKAMRLMRQIEEEVQFSENYPLKI